MEEVIFSTLPQHFYLIIPLSLFSNLPQYLIIQLSLFSNLPQYLIISLSLFSIQYLTNSLSFFSTLPQYLIISLLLISTLPQYLTTSNMPGLLPPAIRAADCEEQLCDCENKGELHLPGTHRANLSS